jgi:hypothetical protein
VRQVGYLPEPRNKVRMQFILLPLKLISLTWTEYKNSPYRELLLLYSCFFMKIEWPFPEKKSGES